LRVFLPVVTDGCVANIRFAGAVQGDADSLKQDPGAIPEWKNSFDIFRNAKSWLQDWYPSQTSDNAVQKAPSGKNSEEPSK